MPSLELRPAKLAKIKDKEDCVLRIEAALKAAARHLDELGLTTNERFRGKWVTEVSGWIERLLRGGVGAEVRNYLVNYHAGDCRLRQRCAQ